MAKIGLTEGFSVIPKGTHVFQITEVNYKEDFGKLEVTMQTATGQKHTERFSLLTKGGEPNNGALAAFSYFATVALNDFSLMEIDHNDLVGRYMRCEVDHDEVPSNRDPSKTVKFVRLGEKEPCDGLDDTPPSAPPADTAPPKPAAGKGGFDLDSLLGS